MKSDGQCVLSIVGEQCKAKTGTEFDTCIVASVPDLNVGQIHNLATCPFPESSPLFVCCQKSTLREGTQCFENVTEQGCQELAEKDELKTTDSQYTRVVDACKRNAIATMSDVGLADYKLPVDGDGDTESLCSHFIGTNRDEPCCEERESAKIAECILLKASPCVDQDDRACCSKETPESQTDCLCAEARPDQAKCCAYRTVAERAACLAVPNLESSTNALFDNLDYMFTHRQNHADATEDHPAVVAAEEPAAATAKAAERPAGADRTAGATQPSAAEQNHANSKLLQQNHADRNLLGAHSDSRRRRSTRRRECTDNSVPELNRALPFYAKRSHSSELTSDAQEQSEHINMLRTCCNCLGKMSGSSFIGQPLKETFMDYASQNPAGEDEATTSGCISPVCAIHNNGGQTGKKYFYKSSTSDNIYGQSSYADKPGDALPAEIYRAKYCDDPGGKWCDSDYGCLVSHVDAKCIQCTCVPECTSWVAAQYGPDHHLTALAETCKSEDGQDFGCVEKQLKSTFCIGTVCDGDNMVANVILAFLAFVGDMLLGCSLGFVAQPSFWINIMGDDAHTAQYQGTKTGIDQSYAAIQAAGDVDPQVEHQAVLDIKNGADARASNVRTPASSSRITSEVVESVSSMKTNTPMKMSTMKNMMKRGLKGCVPCLIAVMVGMAAAFVPGAGAFAYAVSAAAFFGCMKACVIVSFGMAMGFLVFDLVTNCLWTILGNAISSVCFPADALAELRDGRKVAMKDLQVGDTVRSGPDSYSEVYVFSHQVRAAETAFVQITVKTGQSLKLSPSHFIPVSKVCDGTTEMVHASDVKAGSCVLVSGGDSMRQTEVVSHEIVFAKGLYNPFTKEGNIVVNGILASSHSEWFLDELASNIGGVSFLPSIYQAVLGPARWLYNLVGPEIARIELEMYQEKLNSYTAENTAFAPFLDLGWRAMEIVSGH